MAICEYCNQEMTDPWVTTCLNDEIEFPDGEVMKPVPYEGKRLTVEMFAREVPQTDKSFNAYISEYKDLWNDFNTPEERFEYWKKQIGTRCHDCGADEGGYHHPGCDMEKCPRCGGQLTGCGCLDEENEKL